MTASKSRTVTAHEIFNINSNDDFLDYVNKCQNKGFVEDYSKGQTYYYADDKEGNHISLSYDDDFIKTVSITLSANKKDATNSLDNLLNEIVDMTNKTTTDNTSTDNTSKHDDNSKQEIVNENNATTSSKEDKTTDKTVAESNDKPVDDNGNKAELVDGMRPEFKKAMDDYEAFYDEYVVFMNKYAQNPTDLSLLMDYAKIMDKAAKMDASFEQWDENSTNATEWAYYIQVQSRINQKLLGAL